MYAVSNQEDVLLCGAGMRINHRVLAGPGAGGKRLMVPGLSAADCSLVSGGSPSHFPLLIDLGTEKLDSALDQSVELTRVRALIFRTEEERDRIAYVQTADVRLDEVATEVRPELFDMESSHIPAVSGDQAALKSVAIANRIAGSVCGALSVIRSRTDSAVAIAPLFVLNKGGLLRVFAVVHDEFRPSSHEATLLQTCARTLTIASEGLQEDLGAIADEFLRQARDLDPALREKVEQWRAWLQPRIDYRVPIAPGDLTDPHERGSPVLRAMTLLLFRQKLGSLIAQKRDSRSESGPLVAAIAGALAGFREGLDSIDVSIKDSMAGVLDTTACLLDAGPACTPEALGGLFSVTEEQGSDSSSVRLYFCPTGKVVYEGEVRRAPLTLRIRNLLETSGFRVRDIPEGYEVVDRGEVLRVSRVQDALSDAALPEQTKGPASSAAPETSTSGSKGRTRRASSSGGETKPAAKPRAPRSRKNAPEAPGEPKVEASPALPEEAPEVTDAGIDGNIGHPPILRSTEGAPEPELDSSEGDETVWTDERPVPNPSPDPALPDVAPELPTGSVEENPATDLFGVDAVAAGAPAGRKRDPRTSNSKTRTRKPKTPPA